MDDTYLIPSDEVITLHENGTVSMELAHSEEFERMLQKYITASSDDEPPSSEGQTGKSEDKNHQKLIVDIKLCDFHQHIFPF